jgi:hypothetical protein
LPPVLNFKAGCVLPTECILYIITDFIRFCEWTAFPWITQSDKFVFWAAVRLVCDRSWEFKQCLNVVYTNKPATFPPKQGATTLLPKFRHHVPLTVLVPKTNSDTVTAQILLSAACQNRTTLSLAFCISMLFHNSN